MRVFLVRHARAVDERPGLIDEHRYLSEKGRATARAVGKRLAAERVAIDAVLTSPLVRAVQTAELLTEALGWSGAVTTLPALAPGYPPRLVGERLTSYGASVMLVGHEPSISGLGAFLLGRPSFPPFKTSQVAVIEDGQPKWTLDPEICEITQLIVA